MSIERVDLSNANREIEKLNTTLQHSGYELKLNYGSDISEGVEITSFADESDTLLLCIYHNGNCVSSLVIECMGPKISITSLTKPEYRSKKLNRLLCAAIICLSSKIFPSAEMVFSEHVIDTSHGYIMIQHFNATPIDGEGAKIQFKSENLYQEVDIYLKSGKYLDTQLHLTSVNIQNALDVFNRTVSEYFKETPVVATTTDPAGLVGNAKRLYDAVVLYSDNKWKNPAGDVNDILWGKLTLTVKRKIMKATELYDHNVIIEWILSLPLEGTGEILNQIIVNRDENVKAKLSRFVSDVREKYEKVLKTAQTRGGGKRKSHKNKKHSKKRKSYKKKKSHKKKKSKTRRRRR